MTTIIRYVPNWLRVRLQKPAPPKPKTVSKKDRQVLPTLPTLPKDALPSRNDAAVFRYLGR